MPAFLILGLGELRFGNGLAVNKCNCPLDETEMQYQIVNNWTRVTGNHSLKFGGDVRYANNLRVASGVPRNGILIFLPTRTGLFGPARGRRPGAGELPPWGSVHLFPFGQQRHQCWRTPAAVVLLRPGHMARDAEADRQCWPTLGDL